MKDRYKQAKKMQEETQEGIKKALKQIEKTVNKQGQTPSTGTKTIAYLSALQKATQELLQIMKEQGEPNRLQVRVVKLLVEEDIDEGLITQLKITTPNQEQEKG